MVEVHVRDDQVAHLLGCKPGRGESGEQPWHGVVRVVVDEGRLVTLDEQVGRREFAAPHVAAVDGVYARQWMYPLPRPANAQADAAHTSTGRGRC